MPNELARRTNQSVRQTSLEDKQSCPEELYSNWQLITVHWLKTLQDKRRVIQQISSE
jgi:hypothetical protein